MWRGGLEVKWFFGSFLPFVAFETMVWCGGRKEGWRGQRRVGVMVVRPRRVKKWAKEIHVADDGDILEVVAISWSYIR